MPGPSKSQRDYARILIERARDLKESDAFEAAPSSVGRAISPAQVKEDLRASRRKNRRMMLASFVVLLVVGFAALHIPYYSSEWVGDRTAIRSTSEVFSVYAFWFQCTIMPLFDPTLSNQVAGWQAQFDMSMYAEVMNRLAATLVIVACGFLLSVSGLLFQSSFRNPLAAPTMLGVADGVSVGMIVFTMLGYTSLSANPSLYALCVYGGGIVTLVVVLLLSRLMAGGRKCSAMDMLLIGMVISQFLGGAVNYMSNFGMDTQQWETFYQLQQGLGQMDEPLTWIIVIGVFIVTLIPTYFLRFRFNLVSYSDEEQRIMGVRPGVLRGLALALGSLMQLAAIASIGQVAMVSLAVPFLARYMFQNEFRSQLLGNFMVGSVVLLLCSVLQVFTVLSTSAGSVVMPLGTIVAFIIMPLFVVMMALQKRGWE